MSTEHDDTLWRQCERLWAAWLVRRGWTIVALTQATNNTFGTAAPLIHHPGSQGGLIAPDFEAIKDEKRYYWEVKTRRVGQLEPTRSRVYHAMNHKNFVDFCTLERITGKQVHIALYEYVDVDTPGCWRIVALQTIQEFGTQSISVSDSGEPITTIQWDAAYMRAITGPEFPHRPKTPVFTPFKLPTDRQRVPNNPISRTREAANDIPSCADIEERYATVVHALGLPKQPQYSVLQVGNSQISDLLQLLDYGIRVFLITAEAQTFDVIHSRLDAYREVRLLEWSVVPTLDATYAHRLIDGRSLTEEPDWLADVLRAADTYGGINYPQYAIVHADVNTDVLVTAGAGTGKTETMSERLVFLLATATIEHPDRRSVPVSLADISLITFTRDAAREMRSRIARTLITRQRLAPLCILPTLAWIMQLGRANITTIHSFAKALIVQHSGLIDLQPDFRVSNDTMARRRFIREELSQRIHNLFHTEPEQTPPFHQWVAHIETIWDSLENNGVPFMSIRATDSDGAAIPNAPAEIAAFEWRDTYLPKADEMIARITEEVVYSASARFAEYCVEKAKLPTNQLVRSAIQVLTTIKHSTDQNGQLAQRFIPFLFVDEFQDTDALQMELLLLLRGSFRAQLFMVGDAKQGIYRFRGAQGNAFDMLREQMRAHAIPACVSFSMTRNFRSDGNLLDSMQPLFAVWGSQGLLPYTPTDRLVARWGVQTIGVALRSEALVYGDNPTERAAATVLQWRSDNPDASIAILTRHNSSALEIQKEIREHGGQCDVLIGGSFYQSPAVLEMRILLEALLFPDDDAALLELCETRWAGVLFTATHAPSLVSADHAIWEEPLPAFYDWHRRIATLTHRTPMYRTDIAALRRRVTSIAGMMRTLATISFLTACRATLTPDATTFPDAYDPAERARYERGLTHLMTILDETFADDPITPIGLLNWLKIQIATNHNEDEPVDESEPRGRTLALTVHKSKGLEFDCVLIPYTASGFDHVHTSGTLCAVVENKQRRRILWRWIWDEHNSIQNTSDQSTDAWQQNAQEIRQEETRLLYVAMTRAKHLLMLFTRQKPQAHTWGALLEMGKQDAY